MVHMSQHNNADQCSCYGYDVYREKMVQISQDWCLLSLIYPLSSSTLFLTIIYSNHLMDPAPVHIGWSQGRPWTLAHCTFTLTPSHLEAI